MLQSTGPSLRDNTTYTSTTPPTVCLSRIFFLPSECVCVCAALPQLSTRPKLPRFDPDFSLTPNDLEPEMRARHPVSRANNLHVSLCN